jgi:diaminopimelate epimerase
MSDVNAVETSDTFFVTNTGSPHYVQLVKDIKQFDVFSAGKAIRYNDRFKTEGVNVNFIEFQQDHLFVRTYERGVEDETLSCGTGVTAAALVFAQLQEISFGKVQVQTKGGDLMVEWQQQNDLSFCEVFLTGPAKHVYNGTYELKG